MSKLTSSTDGVLVNTLHQTGHSEVTGVLHQPSENAILEYNSELRKMADLQKDLSFGRLVANIPMIGWMELTRKYPKLVDYSNPLARRKEVLRVLSMTENRKYLVRPMKRGKV